MHFQQQRHSLYPAPFSPSSEHRLSLSLANLKKYTKYAVVVQAYNRLGAGPRSEEINVMTGEDGMCKRRVHATSYIIALILGVSQFLVLGESDH